jgi:hypothetical protein
VRQCDEAGVSREEYGSCRGRSFRNDRKVRSTFADNALEELRIGGRKRVLDAGGGDDHGRSASVQGAEMRARVDTFRAPRENGDAGPREVVGKGFGEANAVSGRVPGPHDGNRRRAGELPVEVELFGRLGEVRQAMRKKRTRKNSRRCRSHDTDPSGRPGRRLLVESSVRAYIVVSFPT